MWLLIIYDIRKPKRLAKVAKVMEGYGRRVQYSIFECQLDSQTLKRLQNDLLQIIDQEEDEVKYFRLCSRCWEKARALGQCQRMLPLKELEII